MDDRMKKNMRIPAIVKQVIGGRDEIELINKQPEGNYYPCKPEFVGNGVILHNTHSTRVFKHTEMLEILNDEHERWRIV